MRAVYVVLLCLTAWTGHSAVAFAQPLSLGRVEGPPIAVLDQERLFNQSQFGLRLQAELETASAELARQNREIEQSLAEEELALTEQRNVMPSADFAPLAEEFDLRVTALRDEQAARLREINLVADSAPGVFIELTTPIIQQILAERGAAAVLDARAVIYAADGADITSLALEQIDSVLGDGGDLPLFERLSVEDD